MNRFNLFLILLLSFVLSACSGGGGGGGGSSSGSNTGGGGGGDGAPPPVTRDFSIVLDRIDISRTSNGVSDVPISSGGVFSGDLIYQE